MDCQKYLSLNAAMKLSKSTKFVILAQAVSSLSSHSRARDRRMWFEYKVDNQRRGAEQLAASDWLS